MKKLYLFAIVTSLLFSLNLQAQNKTISATCTLTIKLDNSKNNNSPVPAAYVILDKYNLTAAGYVKEKFDVQNNFITIPNLAEGKYFAEVYIKGIYSQHFSKVITVAKKKNLYSFKLEKTDIYIPKEVVMPVESNDFSKTSVVFMK